MDHQAGAKIQQERLAKDEADAAADSAAAAAAAQERRNAELDLQKVSHPQVFLCNCKLTRGLAATHVFCSAPHVPWQTARATKAVAERKFQREALMKAFPTAGTAAADWRPQKTAPPKDVEMGFLNNIIQQAGVAGTMPSGQSQAARV